MKFFEMKLKAFISNSNTHVKNGWSVKILQYVRLTPFEEFRLMHTNPKLPKPPIKHFANNAAVLFPKCLMGGSPIGVHSNYATVNM